MPYHGIGDVEDTDRQCQARAHTPCLPHQGPMVGPASPDPMRSLFATSLLITVLAVVYVGCDAQSDSQSDAADDSSSGSDYDYE